MKKETKEKIQKKFEKYKKEFRNSEEWDKLSPQGRGFVMSWKMSSLIQEHYDGNEVVSLGYLENEAQFGDMGVDKEGNRYVYQDGWIKIN